MGKKTKKEESEIEKAVVVFKLPETVVFPKVLFENAKDMDEVRKSISEHFVAVQEKDVIANRLMDSQEINEIREEYGEIAESRLPELIDELATLEAKFKCDKKQIEAQIASANTHFKDLVSFARSGIKDYPLDMSNTFRIPVLNYYLYYTWINEHFEIAMVHEIPFHEQRDIFNSVEKNKESFEALGYTLPEIDIVDPRNNLRRFSKEGMDYEVWEEGNKVFVSEFWEEDFVDEASGEVTTIPRKETKEFSKEDYPQTSYSEIENEQTEIEEGTTNELQEELTE